VIATGGDVTVSFLLKNTGIRAGKEVAQVYVRDEVSSVTTPVMKLTGFEKVSLQTGEAHRVRITIPSTELSLWNREMKRVIESGFFTVMVAASADEIKLRGRFEVAGTPAGKREGDTTK